MPMRSRVVIDPYNDKAVPAIWPWGSIARAAMKIVLTNWSVFQKLSWRPVEAVLPAIAAAKESVLSDDTAELLLKLDQKVDPKHCALVVIDVQNDFAADGGFFDRVGADLQPIRTERVPALLRLITGARRTGVLVIFI